MIPSWLADVVPVAIKGGSALVGAIRDRRRPVAERLQLRPRPVSAALRAMLAELEAREGARAAGQGLP